MFREDLCSLQGLHCWSQFAFGSRSIGSILGITMRWTVHVSFLNGDRLAISIDPDASVEDLRLEAQRKIKNQVAGLLD